MMCMVVGMEATTATETTNKIQNKMNTYKITYSQRSAETAESIASTETLFVSLINKNAEKIKCLAAFKTLSKQQMLKLKGEYLASFLK